jgi:hypothetical protein
MTRTGEYEKVDADAAGLDPAKLRAAMDYANFSIPLTIKVFRHGCLLAQGPRDPLFDRVPVDNWGQTKVITTLITGIGQDQGLINIDAPIGAYLPAGLGDAVHRAVDTAKPAAGVIPSRPAGASTHESFRLSMAAVTDMPNQVRATIANPGPYNRGPEAGADATQFLYPLDALAGSYLSIGPGAAPGCNPLGYEGRVQRRDPAVCR